MLEVEGVRPGKPQNGVSNSCKISFSTHMIFSMHARFEGWTMVIEFRYKKKDNVKNFLFMGPLILKSLILKKFHPSENFFEHQKVAHPFPEYFQKLRSI